jgi:hypothetical protein
LVVVRIERVVLITHALCRLGESRLKKSDTASENGIRVHTTNMRGFSLIIIIHRHGVVAVDSVQLCASVSPVTSTVLIGILRNLVGILRLIWASEIQKVDDIGEGHQGQSLGQMSKKIRNLSKIRGKKNFGNFLP